MHTATQLILHNNRTTKNRNQETSVYDVKQWAERSWSRVSQDWVNNRKERYAYRNAIVLPKIVEVLSLLRLDLKSRIVDLGCGDGQETIMLKTWLSSRNLRHLPILGLDNQPKLLNYAKWIYQDQDSVNFEQVDITNSLEVAYACQKYLGGLAKLITCVYVLHDTPSAIDVLKNARKILEPGGFLLSIIVHPNWAETLRREGQITDMDFSQVFQETDYDSKPLWRWRGYFPLVRESGRPFYLPYFHRSLTDYLHAFQLSHFQIKLTINMGLETRTKQYDGFRNEFLFQKSRNNPYWPSISLMPSSILCLAQKIR